MTKPGRTASSTARVLRQVGTGAAFAVLFGLAGAATANAREVKAQQPPHRCAGDCSGNRSGGDKISKSLGDLKHETAKALEKFANEKPKGDKRMVRRDDSKKNSRKKDNSKAEFGAGFERGEDGKFRLQGKGGVTGPLGGSTGFEVSPKDDVLRLDREPHK